MIATRSHADYTPPASPRKGGPGIAASRIPVADYAYDPDIHMNTAKNATLKDFKMQAARNAMVSGLPVASDNTLNDIRMETARGAPTVKGGLRIWELELVESAEVKRKATVAQLCMAIHPDYGV